MLKDKAMPCSIWNTAIGKIFPIAGLALLLGLGMMGSVAHAGGIAGTITDAGTGLPLSGIDLDIYDANFASVPGINDSSAGDGTYLLSPLPAGQYYLRADPSASQGFVDQYYPGVFLKGQATPVTVSDIGTVIVNFSLAAGAPIAGTIRDAGTGLPLAGIDLDVFATDLSFIPSINTRTAADGTFTLGAFPSGSFFVKADPETSMYVTAYYANQFDLGMANPVQVVGTTAVSSIDFNLILGGKIAGKITDAATGLPLSGVDLDLFDSLGNFISAYNATSALDGSFMLGAISPGTYYLQADPTAAMGYMDTYFGNSTDFLTAVPIVVGPGQMVGARDIALSRGGTITGQVTALASGLPVAGLRVSVFDSLGSIMPGIGSSTAVDGSFTVGAVPSGNYFLRCGGDSLLGLAYEFYPGVNFVSEAQSISALAGTNLPGINFALKEGGWITGRVRDFATGLPHSLIDMDVYSPTFEFVGALDADTDALGNFVLGPVPNGRFVIRAHPALSTGLPIQYYDHSPDTTGALPLDLVAPQSISGVDFDLGYVASPVDPQLVPESRSMLQGAFPNPFNPSTRILFDLPRDLEVQLNIYSVRGVLVAELEKGFMGAGRHAVAWDGTDRSGNPVGSGVFFARLVTPGSEEMTKLVLVK